MARFCSLFSSSSGNSTFIGSSRTGILIDAGVTAKKLREALSGRDIDPESIKGIFITHEHIDHIKDIKVFCSAHGIPVYATKGTCEGLSEADMLNGKFPVQIIGEEGAEIGDLFIKPFRTPHDSNESCGYKIFLPDERTVCVATDIGHITEEITKNLIGSDLVMIESNHDIGMLQNGMYPYYLKRRILSDRGHLSNVACAELTKELVKNGTTRLFLGHLSTDNNMPELAYQTNFASIYETGAVLDRDYMLEVNAKENTKQIVRF